MADEYTVKATGGDSSYAPVPEGQTQAVCVDVVLLGYKLEQFPGSEAKVVEKVALVWQTSEDNPDTNRPFELSKEFTLSFHEKASLRKFLGGWRGKSYTDQEAREVGAPLHKLVGVNAILTVEHKVSQKGRTYAVVSNATPLLKQMTKMEARGYTRPDFWETRKAEYAEDAARHRAATAPVVRREPEVVLAAAAAETDDLPF
jgi:hypothetical protein